MLGGSLINHDMAYPQVAGGGMASRYRG